MIYEMWGRPARLVIEVEMHRSTIRVPVTGWDVLGDGYPYQELRAPLKGRWLTEVRESMDTVEQRMGG